jgi:hypothetical protein
MVRSAREHVTSRYAAGLEAELWKLFKTPLRDLDAVRAVAEAAERDGQADALDLGAALVLVQAVHQYLARTEVRLIDAATAAGVGWEAIAAVLGLPGADAARRHYRQLGVRGGEPEPYAEAL